MATRNYIVVGALRNGRTLTDLDVPAYVSDELRRMSHEQYAYAQRTEIDAIAAMHAVGALRHQHDYRPVDHDILTERSLVYETLAGRLLELADDEDYARTVADDARAAAWREVGGVIEARLDLQATAPVDPDYSRLRKTRMRQLREVDLPTLEPDYSRWQTD
ncbi:MAG: hypothetical protein JWM50_1298 [Microbacteriaceae bacterium]|jgi:hypothetical protein|nr:hypothetical protein [Microbacteriaceae bacterium]